MNIFTANHVAVHNVHLPSPSSPALIFGRSIGRILKVCGRGLADAPRAYAQALELALVKTCGVSVERQRLVPDADGEGRNPSW